jgi:hypothetical protein
MGAPSLDNLFKSRHRKTRRLGRHNLHGFRVYPKKFTAFDQAGDVYVTGARAFQRSRRRAFGKDFDAPSKEARLI